MTREKYVMLGGCTPAQCPMGKLSIGCMKIGELYREMKQKPIKYSIHVQEGCCEVSWRLEDFWDT